MQCNSQLGAKDVRLPLGFLQLQLWSNMRNVRAIRIFSVVGENGHFTGHFAILHTHPLPCDMFESFWDFHGYIVYFWQFLQVCAIWHARFRIWHVVWLVSRRKPTRQLTLWGLKWHVLLLGMWHRGRWHSRRKIVDFSRHSFLYFENVRWHFGVEVERQTEICQLTHHMHALCYFARVFVIWHAWFKIWHVAWLACEEEKPHVN